VIPRLLRAAARCAGDLRLQQKLSFLYLFVIVLPLLVFSLVSSNRASVAIEREVEQTAKRASEQAGAFLSYKIGKLFDTSKVILSDPRINAILAQEPREYTIHEQIRDLRTLSLFLGSFPNREEIHNVVLYVNSEFMYSNEGVNVGSLATVRGMDWYERLLARKDNTLWVAGLGVTPPSANTDRDPASTPVSLLRFIHDANDYTRSIGLLRIDVPQEQLRDILALSTPTPNGLAFLVNAKGKTLVSSPRDVGDSTKGVLAHLAGPLPTEGRYESRIIGGVRHSVSTRSIAHTDWLMASITPYNDIAAFGRRVRYEMLATFILIGAIAYTTASLVSASVTRRIGALIRTMRGVRNGKFGAVVPSESKDEIGELIETFNDMSRRLVIMKQEHVRMGQDMKHYEVLALQSQINPHFLYNTLDLINWAAIRSNVPDISSTVQSLSRFFKISLSKGSGIIQIRDEVEHVRLYMDIQNRRYANAFRLEIRMDEDVMRCMTIKTILQPIVENSIAHGILGREPKAGTILVSGRIADGVIHLQVEDDGVGMSAATVDGLLSGPTHDPDHGYGIRNVNERIRLYYGEAYGLAYRSEIGRGTVATITFPALPNNPAAKREMGAS
jgi:two-component system sensor histidine kinase YesM